MPFLFCRRKGKSRNHWEGQMRTHCSPLSQSQAVTQHWVPGASPQHRLGPQMPPPSSLGSPGHGDYPGRKTGPPAHPTHPDGKVVHTVHFQVLGYLQILHFSFISVRQEQCLGGSERDMAAPADPKHSPGFKAWTVSITQGQSCLCWQDQ